MSAAELGRGLSLWVSVSPPGKRAPSRDFAICVSGGRGPPILRVTWRAHSAYLRPSDLSCRFLLAADPGRALARLFPGLPEGGAGAVWGGAGRGRDPGPRFRGDRGARTQTATHSGAAVPGEQTQGPRVRPPLSSTFCLAPPSGKAPRGLAGAGSPFPPPDRSVDKGGGGIPECRGHGSEQLLARWDLRTCLQVSASLGSPASTHALQSLGVSEHVPFSLYASASFPAGMRGGSGVTLLQLRLRRQDWPGAGWSLLPFRAGERAPHSETTGLASCQDAPVMCGEVPGAGLGPGARSRILGEPPPCVAV